MARTNQGGSLFGPTGGRRSGLSSRPPDAPPDAFDAWAAVWGEVAERHPDLTPATRLFGVGVRYLLTKDERVLLDLVREERAVLRDLSRLDDTVDQR